MFVVLNGLCSLATLELEQTQQEICFREMRVQLDG